MDTSSQLFSPAQLDAETRSAFGNPSLAWNPVHGPIARCKGIAWQWHRDDENNTLHVCVCDSLGFRDAWGMPISDERAASILAEQAGTGAFYTAATNAGRRWEAEAEAEGWR